MIRLLTVPVQDGLFYFRNNNVARVDTVHVIEVPDPRLKDGAWELFVHESYEQRYTFHRVDVGFGDYHIYDSPYRGNVLPNEVWNLLSRLAEPQKLVFALRSSAETRSSTHVELREDLIPMLVSKHYASFVDAERSTTK